MKHIKTFKLFENDSVETLGTENGMGPVLAPIVSEVPGQVNILPSQQQVNEIMSFQEFLNEDGTACSTAGNSNGMGNISAPVIGSNNTGQLNSYSGNGNPTSTGQKGSGDSVAHGGTYQNIYQQHIPKKKKKKYNLKPKIKKFEHVHLGLGTDLENGATAYVTRLSDWEYPM